MSDHTMKKKSAVKRFARNERGSLIIFSLFIFVCQLLIVGIGLDLVRTEAARTRLQNTTDAAVLAAADLDQVLDPTAVVNDYFKKAGLENFLTSIDVLETVNSKQVTASASADVPSMFLNMVGVDKLTAPATSTAIEGITDVEVSLVLDISGSMSAGTKMADLRNAANLFIDLAVDDQKTGGVSLSVVPYTSHVNAGSAILDQMNVARLHNYSNCVEFEETDFNSTGISMTRSYDQMQHFEYSSSWTSPITNPTCPQQSFEEITAFSENIPALKGQINQLTPRSNTAIHLGMKWGVALLDPSSRGVVSNLIAAGESSGSFNGRPYNWDRPDTLKIAIVMTDGLNVNTSRVRSQFYDTTAEIDLFAERSLGRIASENGVNWQSLVEVKYTAFQADTMLLNVCNAAKQQGIIIYAVGLEVTDYSRQLLETCSSATANYFGVSSAELDDAFAAIAQQINSLRLTR